MMIAQLIGLLIFELAFADKVGLVNQRLTTNENSHAAVDNHSGESKIRHHTSYQSKEPIYTNYHFFRPKGKKWNHGKENRNEIRAPLGRMLKEVLLTGMFDVTANLVRLDIVPTRKETHSQPHPFRPSFDKLLYNYYPEPSPLWYPIQENIPQKRPFYGSQLAAKPLLQHAVDKPLTQFAVTQTIVPQTLASKGYGVSHVVSLPGNQNVPHELPSLAPLPEHLPFTTDAAISATGSGINGPSVQVPFENMYQQYQDMQEKSHNTEQSYMELSKLYEIMNAMKAIHTEKTPNGLENNDNKNQTPATKQNK